MFIAWIFGGKLGKKRNQDTTRAMKALTLYSLLLFSGKRYSLTELADKLDCSKPTIFETIKDIESTHALHVPINSELIGGQRYYWSMRPEKKPNTSLAANAIQDLTLCRDLLANVLPPVLRDEIDTTITQTTVLLQDYDEELIRVKARAQGLDVHCGFDLHVRRADRSTIAVEIKDRMRSGEIELSSNEWAKACNLGDRYWLYVVYDCATSHPRLIRDQNPFQKLVAKGATWSSTRGRFRPRRKGYKDVFRSGFNPCLM